MKLMWKRRGVALLLFGLLLISRGLDVYLSEPPVFDPGRGVLYEFLSVPVRTGLWFTFGTITMAFAWTRYQYLGFITAMVMPLERMTSYLWSSWLYIIPGGSGGTRDAVANAMTWMAVSAIIFLVAGWITALSEGKDRT